jgi:hypothetical protein
LDGQPLSGSNLTALCFVIPALSVRAIFFIIVTLVCTLGATSDSLAGKWVGRSPDPIGRTEDIELRFIPSDSGFSGVLHTADRDITLMHVRLQGRNLTFDATRELRGHNILYHYDGSLSGDSINFTVQNDDGSSFFSFTVHHEQ